MPPKTLRFALLAALTGVAAAAAAASPPAALARAAGDGAGLAVVARDGGRVELRDGARRQSLTLPARARVDAVARLDAGWVIAGSTAGADGGEALWLLRDGPAGAVPMAAPAGGAARLRLDPTALTRDGQLAGLAWLEGDDRRALGVRYAAWTGSGFAPPVVVAPSGPGSQLALAGTRLADGRLLLVWAGYDGRDDEIWAALGADGQWSAPERVGGDNRVPDITPDVVAVGDGALVAWSRFESGEYRVYTARFAGGRFGPATPAAEPGSLFPTFERDGARGALLFRDARRRGWGLREIGDDGAPGRTGRVAELGSGRPLVRLGERGVEWEFGAASEATAWE
ncbi:MAG: hypothetical protein NDJ75_08465 [Thermoanaerobaculia bacterium]|nr:hypothetical protein [Thermoanaerobaculia bacterium]